MPQVSLCLVIQVLKISGEMRIYSEAVVPQSPKTNAIWHCKRQELYLPCLFFFSSGKFIVQLQHEPCKISDPDHANPGRKDSTHDKVASTR